MNLHEYQAKQILAGRGIAVPSGEVAETAEAARAAARRLGAERFAVKAQVHAGGRGRAGGVQIVDTAEQVHAAADALIGTVLVTEQTGAEGHTVHKVYVEEAVETGRVVYVAVLVDQSAGQVALIGAEQGGEDIEDRIAADPGIVQEMLLGTGADVAAADFEGFAKLLGFAGEDAQGAAQLFAGLVETFVALDASLIEINPLAVTEDGRMLALDVKMIVDDNALFRHEELKDFRDEDELDPVELAAQRHEINYVRMDGNVGIVVNGAGLALATHDMLRDAGIQPANFMDIRTTASSLDIARGVDLLVANPNVKAVFVNVHGGGMQRCDTIAEGIGISLKRCGRTLPIVLRFAGNNADYGRTLLDNYGISYLDTADMADAVERVAALVKREAA